MRRADGFTLLEILVALVVFGFLMLGLSEGTRFGVRAWNVQSQRVDRVGALEAVDRTLRDLIEAADPGSAGSGGSLQGDAGRVRFTAPLPRAAGAALADVAIGLDRSHHLVLLWRPHRHVIWLGAPPVGHREVLLEGVAALEIAYWPRRGGGWRQAWSDRDLPALVRLRLRFADRRRWPEIVAAPQQ